jgi:4-phytase/acid phosphatase
MHRPARITLSLAACLAVALPAWAAARPDSARPSAGRYRVDRVVLLIRHGIRAPLDGEAAAAPLADQPFPRWNTPPSQLTPHGAQALERLASYMRTRFVGQGLLPGGGCPQSGQLAIWTNSKSRTIASGQALAQGSRPVAPCRSSIAPKTRPIRCSTRSTPRPCRSMPAPLPPASMPSWTRAAR